MSEKSEPKNSVDMREIMKLSLPTRRVVIEALNIRFELLVKENGWIVTDPMSEPYKWSQDG